MANANNTKSRNKYFSNAEQAYTELFQLLPRMTQEFKPDRGFSFTCDSGMLAAAAQHASNATSTLTNCMQSLGVVIAYAAESGELTSKDVANMGWLMQVLTNLIEACNLLQNDTKFELAERKEPSI